MSLSASTADHAPTHRRAPDEPAARPPTRADAEGPRSRGAGAQTVDLLVVGSGAGGLSAAVTAAALGLSVRVVEKEAVLGGTTAWSGGWMWLPGHPLAREAGFVEDPEAPRRYLRHELGEHHDAARVDAFLDHAPLMVEFFRRHTAMAFIDGQAIPDFHGRSPGAVEGGRQLGTAAFDARRLGADLHRLRPPLDLISLWGMGIASGPDLRHFMNSTRSLRSLGHVLQRVGRHLLDIVLHGRGMHLVNGNALAARLMRSALDRGVDLRTGSPVLRLLSEQGRVCGAVVGAPDGSQTTVHARCGVVLACGGFPHDARRMAGLDARGLDEGRHPSAAPPSNTGDGLRLGEAVGGRVADDLASVAAWAPVSLVPQSGGRVGRFPHLIERAKPGLIAVTRQGRRFVNEADSYHDFMSGLFAAVPPGEPVQAWLICDHRFIRRWGLGHARPAPVPLAPSLRSGYLQRGDDLADLARRCGIDAAALVETVQAHNRHARDGRDPEFGRGETPYNRANGDAGLRPNPCVAPIEHGPFYAVRVLPGSLGTFAGLRTDARGRVLDEAGRPIAGLWAGGNDMASIMGGRYPSGGITLGPAMTFGYLIAHDAAGVAPGTPLQDAAPRSASRSVMP
ncbi:succinate dehydrogenase/fumarate reductase flavoprotein subunit [Sphaerotilus hippei]|uniref:Succinate dehydrogenase/fumarate reductase flavoprotein subunit n=1 Tax=Sphaerotilus hippei TaxID=744406 RepID=A0A318H252_9BURK|nr:FAD-dependent oxidoreductase [Sphaerotilus hippei]PXW97410.1 succinate dehydrogenase/fumarate reductase flavoprotein subunit [Sphaerotilus hippei]